MPTTHVLAAGIEWGTVGEWAGAIGAISAGAIALWIAIRDGRERDHERRDAEAAQARCVVATLEYDKEPRNLAGERHLRVRVANYSSEPVTRVNIQDISPLLGSWRIGNDPERARKIFAAVIPPGEEAVSDPVEIGVRASVREPMPIERSVFPCIQFVDSHGLGWERVGLEKPKRVIHEDHIKDKTPLWNWTAGEPESRQGGRT